LAAMEMVDGFQCDCERECHRPPSDKCRGCSNKNACCQCCFSNMNIIRLYRVGHSLMYTVYMSGWESEPIPSAKNTIFRIWYQNVQQNLLCLVPESTVLCFARIILQRAKCATCLYGPCMLLGADSTMYIGHSHGLLQVGP